MRLLLLPALLQGASAQDHEPLAITPVAVQSAAIPDGPPMEAAVNAGADLEVTVHGLTRGSILHLSAGNYAAPLHIGRINIGQGAYSLAGGYVSAILVTQQGFSFWATLPLAGIFCALVAVLIGLPILWGLAAFALIMLILALWRGLKGWPLRSLAAITLLAAPPPPAQKPPTPTASRNLRPQRAGTPATSRAGTPVARRSRFRGSRRTPAHRAGAVRP